MNPSVWSEIETLVRADDHRAALLLLLATWRERPAPWLAEIIDAVSAQGTASRGAIPGKTVMDRRASWDKVSKTADPLDIPRLLDALIGFGAGVAADRLKRLSPRDNDPRLAAPLLRWAQTRPNGYQGQASEDFWRAVGAALAASRDVRVLPALEELQASLLDKHGYSADYLLSREVLPEVIAALRAVPTHEIDAGAETLLALLASPAPGKPADLDALFQAVYSDPSSDEPRWVLADALQEVGDPRGEFIALQLKPKPTREDKKRAKALETAYNTSWIGALGKASPKSSRTFARGFLTSCRLSHHPDVPSLTGERALATVTDLDLNGYGSVDFFEQTPLLALQRLEGRCFCVFQAKRPLPVREIVSVEDGPVQGITPILRDCVSLPKLEVFNISTRFEPLDAWASVLSSPFAAPLRHLSLWRVDEAPGPWRRMARDKAPWLESFALSTGVSRLRFSSGEITLTHDVTTYAAPGSFISGSDAEERSLEQLQALLSSGLLEPADVLTIHLVRGRHASGDPKAISEDALVPIRRAVEGRVSALHIINVV